MFFISTTNDTLMIEQSILFNDIKSTSRSCSCTEASIAYSRFIVGNFVKHHFCSSSFVSPQWLQYLEVARGNTPLLSTDFRNMILPIFKALYSLCYLMDPTARGSLMRFHSNIYNKNQIVSSDLFMTEIQSSIEEFISSTVNDFLSPLHPTYEIIQENVLSTLSIIGSYASNYTMARSISYGNCTCDGSTQCLTPATFYNGISNQILMVVPGMYSGCDPFEALSVSTLECLYDQTCLNSIIGIIPNANVNVNITILTASHLSTFMPTSTVGEILNQMMIDRWNWNISYENYYQACAPMACNSTVNSYIIERKQPVIFIVTMAIGLIGGLVVILKLVISCIIRAKTRKATVETDH